MGISVSRFYEALGHEAAQDIGLIITRGGDEGVHVHESGRPQHVQVLTGCTFGKGNLIFKDHGKQVLTLLSRKTGDGVRVALKAGALELNEEHGQLMGKIRKGDATDIEKNRFQELHLMRSRNIMENTEEALFDVRETHEALPPKAIIEPSKPCDRCGEPTMASRLNESDGMKLCGGCLKG
ncbi:MAG: formylmethanofuran dehydrogenase [Deltaproteobacteria bacterium]|nr:formylmethanofuran dehydrogenase [Deltaproteobacteria bacterium]